MLNIYILYIYNIIDVIYIHILLYTYAYIVNHIWNSDQCSIYVFQNNSYRVNVSQTMHPGNIITAVLPPAPHY